MSWINQYIKGTFSIFSGSVSGQLQPINFTLFLPMWYPIWVKRIAKVIKKLDLHKKKYNEISNLLPVPSSIRFILIQIISFSKIDDIANPRDYKLVTNFLARMLQECCPSDPFGYISNPAHSREEIQSIINQTSWKESNEDISGQISRLSVTSGSLVHALYNDCVTDYGWEVYGPYYIKHNEQDYTLLIRDFSNLKPVELWQEKYLPSVFSIKILSLYQDIEWEVRTVGCHLNNTSGNPITALKKYALFVDNKLFPISKIKQLTLELSEKTESLFRHIQSFDFEKIKKLVMLQECFQLNKMFSTAGYDWRPNREMYEVINNKPLLKAEKSTTESITSIDQYIKEYDLSRFAQEILNHRIK